MKKILFVALALLFFSGQAFGVTSEESIWNNVYDETTDSIRVTVGSGSGITMADDTWIGLGSAAGRWTFDDQTVDGVYLSNGALGIGTAPASITRPDLQPGDIVQAGGTSGSVRHTFDCYSATDGRDTTMFLRKSSNSTIGTIAETGDAESLGQIDFMGGDTGPNFDNGAQIYAEQKGVSGAKVPTDLYITTWSSTAQNTNQMVVKTTGATLFGDNGASITTGKIGVLAADDGVCAVLKINANQAGVTTNDTFIDFRSTTGSEGTIAGTAAAGVLIFNTFCGSHFTQIVDKTGLETFSLLEAVDERPVFEKRVRTVKKYKDEIQADGTNKKIKVGEEQVQDGPSDKQQLFKSRICSTKGSKAAIGAYGGTDNDGRDMILSIGTGFAIVANKGKDVEIGDYLESSNVKGCAELQNDGIYRNSTVAKATQNIHWAAGETKRTISVVYLGG